MGENNEICMLHGQMAADLTSMNKDIGKVSERVGRIEENTKHLPEIQQDIKAIKEQKSRTIGFVAGVSFAVSSMFSVASWAINHFLGGK